MSHYQPNIQDMQFVLSYVLNAPDQLKSLQVFEELDGELVQQVLEEAFIKIKATLTSNNLKKLTALLPKLRS